MKEINQGVARLVVGEGTSAVKRMAAGMYSMAKYHIEPDKGFQSITDASLDEKAFFISKATDIFSKGVNAAIKEFANEKPEDQSEDLRTEEASSDSSSSESGVEDGHL